MKHFSKLIDAVNNFDTRIHKAKNDIHWARDKAIKELGTTYWHCYNAKGETEFTFLGEEYALNFREMDEAEFLAFYRRLVEIKSQYEHSQLFK